MSQKSREVSNEAATGPASRIKWRACGRERRDRVGFVDGAEALRITHLHGRSGYALSFHHEEKAHFVTLAEARARAERDLERWSGERQLRREQEAAATARRLRDRRERDERLAGIIARLNAAGFEAREVFGAVTLTDEAAQDLLARLVAST